jgi:uncharacterized membrane-anchored protein YitT (DUF2179 family)
MKENFDLKLAWQDIKIDFSEGHRVKTLQNYLFIIFGSILLSAGDALFLIPYNIVSGGVAGLGIVLVEFNPSWNVNLVITILQISLFFLGFVLLGAKFTLRTLLSTLIYPSFLFLFDYLLSLPDFGAFISLGSVAAPDTGTLLLAGFFGGGIVGVGCGLTFIGGGSTGGTDCISLALSKYFHIKASVGSLVSDMLIILSNIFYLYPNHKNVIVVLIGVASAFACAVLIDKTYIGDNSYVGFIVSDKWEEINNRINTELERGTTLIDSYGGYTGNEKTMIEVAFTTDEYDAFRKLIFQIDPKAFLTVLDAYEVTGFGFRKVPFRINREIQYEQKRKSKKLTKAQQSKKQGMQYLQTRDESKEKKSSKGK